jgi:hypothetical protein
MPPVSEPRAVATGSSTEFKSELLGQRLSGDPVATARGSDTEQSRKASTEDNS